MTRLTEGYVQRVAVEWLATRCQEKPGVQVVLAETQAAVRQGETLGSGCADGLVAAQLSDGTIYTASLEAKSWKTLYNIVPVYEDRRWALHTVLAGMIGCILAELVGGAVGGWFWICVLPPLAFIAVGVAYLLLTAAHHYRPIDVIAQIKRYPANEQWIALSTDAYNRLRPEEQEALHSDCQKEGIGLVLVSAGEKVTPLEDPKAQSLPRGYADFLTCYTKSETIRQGLREKLAAARSEEDDAIAALRAALTDYDPEEARRDTEALPVISEHDTIAISIPRKPRDDSEEE